MACLPGAQPSKAPHPTLASAPLSRAPSPWPCVPLGFSWGFRNILVVGT